MNLEVVLENIEEAKLAEKYRIKRVEICTGLELGGLTPSKAVIETMVDVVNCEVHAMIRPRPGGFVYNSHEINIMKKDIAFCKKIGCKGIVFGALTSQKQIDYNNTRLLSNYAKSLELEITFHRAIDFTVNINNSVEILIDLGVTRILTSGGENNVDIGMMKIKEMIANYNNYIQIMAGGGVNISNVRKLINSGVKDLHFNIRKESDYQSNLLMGLEYKMDEEKLIQITKLVKSTALGS